jgi:hypothetical protein
MVFLQYEVASKFTTQDAGAEPHGAFVNCWIDRSTVLEAETTAKQMIEAQGWRIIQTLEAKELQSGEVGMGENAREYFEQAQVDGEVLLFNAFPNR